MRYNLIPLLIVLSAVLMRGQSGPCVETAVKQGNLPSAEDAFAYMPHPEASRPYPLLLGFRYDHGRG